MPARKQQEQTQLPSSSSSSSSLLQHPDALYSLKKDQLISLCKRHGLTSSGKKPDLIARLQCFANQHLDRENPTQGNFVVLRSTSQKSLAEDATSDAEDEQIEPLSESGKSSSSLYNPEAQVNFQSEESAEVPVKIPVRRGGRKRNTRNARATLTSTSNAASSNNFKTHTSSYDSNEQNSAPRETVVDEEKRRRASKSSSQVGEEILRESSAEKSIRIETENAELFRSTRGTRANQSSSNENADAEDEVEDSNAGKTSGPIEVEKNMKDSKMEDSQTEKEEIKVSSPETSSALAATTSLPPKKSTSSQFNTPKLYPSLQKFQSQHEEEEDQQSKEGNQDEVMKEVEKEGSQTEDLSPIKDEPLQRQIVGSFPDQVSEKNYSFINHPKRNGPSKEVISSIIPNRSSSLEEFGVNSGEGSKLSQSKSNSSMSSLSSLSSLTSSLRKKAGKLFSGTLSRKRGIEQVEKEDEEIIPVEEENNRRDSQMLLDGLPLEPNSPRAMKSAREILNEDAPDSPQPIRIIKPRPSRATSGRGSTSSISISPAKPISSQMIPSPLKSSTTASSSTSTTGPMPFYSTPSSATAAVIAEMNARLAASGHSTSTLSASTSGLSWSKASVPQAPRFQLPSSFNSNVRFDKAHEKQFGKLEGIDQHYAARRKVSNESIKPMTKKVKTQETQKPLVTNQEISGIERRKRERALNAARRKAGNPAALKIVNEREKAKARAEKMISSTSSNVSDAKKKAGFSRFTSAVKNVFDFNSQNSSFVNISASSKATSSTAKVIVPSTSLSSKPSGSSSGSGSVSTKTSRSLSAKPSDFLPSKSSNSLSSKASTSLSFKSSTSLSSKPYSLTSFNSNTSVGSSSRTPSSSSTSNFIQKEKPKFDLQASLKKTPTGYKPYSAKEALEGLKAENSRLVSTSSNRAIITNLGPTNIPSPIKPQINRNNTSTSNSTLKFPIISKPLDADCNEPTKKSKNRISSKVILSPSTRRPRIDPNRLVNKKKDAQSLASALALKQTQLKNPEQESSQMKTEGKTFSEIEEIPSPKIEISSSNPFQTLTSPTSPSQSRTSMPVFRLKSGGKVRSSISANAHKGTRKSVDNGVRKARAGL